MNDRRRAQLMRAYQNKLYETKMVAKALGNEQKFCVTPDCISFTIVDGTHIVHCPKCKVKQCVSCQVKYDEKHIEISCKLFQARLRAEKKEMPIEDQLKLLNKDARGRDLQKKRF